MSSINASPVESPQHAWWKEAVVYQIYPASFRDLSGDGWGDIKGITSKVDYIKDLGADIVWLSPIYKSPQADMGYDIADYKDIDPRYGTLIDVDELIAELEKRNMKLMMDLVVNHTSEEHAWFLESRSSRTNPKRDWYHWQPAKFAADGTRIPPNNWSQILGEANSAWTWDSLTEEYYLTLFTPEQPDLNWENPEVRAAVHDVLEFWLKRGACGFRMDVINLISKVPGYPDGEVVASDHKYQPGSKYFANGPRLHEFLQEMNRKVLSKYNAVTVGEMPFVRDEDEIIKIVHPDREELKMIFIFELMDIDNTPGSYRMTLHEWQPSQIRKSLARWQKLMLDRGGWNSLFCENHDNPRSVSRFTSDNDQNRELGSKLLCLMITTLAGTLYVYQGQELGMRNFPLSWEPEEYKDIETINYWKKMQDMHHDDPHRLKMARTVMQRKSRDHSRTPMQWTDEAPNAGFCDKYVKSWMKVNDDFTACNAKKQTTQLGDDQLSVFQFWKRGLENRKLHKNSFVYGGFELLGPEDDASPVFAYTRFDGQKEKWVVVLNFSGEKVGWEIPHNAGVEEWVAGNYVTGKPERDTKGTLTLLPWEGVLGQCAI
ncbi:glycoside hydrolase [Tothia fuscella]|uniref:Glycoside hydrolase n=1 Tax=Tothia fuscella TaxID=1048955 RepID=A0A9P4U3S6_9PEZI|nr:glycoside hydrolase [Tothia fuscella]